MEDGIFYKKEDVHDVFDDANEFLTHRYNSLCLVKGPNSKLRFRMPDYFEVSGGQNSMVRIQSINLLTYLCTLLMNVGSTSQIST